MAMKGTGASVAGGVADIIGAAIDAEAKRDVAETNLEGTKFKANKELTGTKYTADKSFDSTKFSSNKSFQAVKYSTNAGYKLGLDTNRTHYKTEAMRMDKAYTNAVAGQKRLENLFQDRGLNPTLLYTRPTSLGSQVTSTGNSMLVSFTPGQSAPNYRSQQQLYSAGHNVDYLRGRKRQ